MQKVKALRRASESSTDLVPLEGEVVLCDNGTIKLGDGKRVVGALEVVPVDELSKIQLVKNFIERNIDLIESCRFDELYREHISAIAFGKLITKILHYENVYPEDYIKEPSQKITQMLEVD